MNEINEFIKSIRKPVSDKQVMILRLQFNKRILKKARWYEPGKKLRAIKDILDALNYLVKDREVIKIEGTTAKSRRQLLMMGNMRKLNETK